MICKSCENEMRKMQKYWFCEICGGVYPINDDKVNKNNWKYNEDGTLLTWVNDNDLKFMPFVIAHEYNRIRILLEDNQPYGAVMQLKDAYECIVKFLVLKECARIYIKENKNDKEITILKILTEKLLLLSNWKNLMNDISDLSDVEEDTKKIMKSIVTLLQGELKVIDWRNRVIGHGALGYADNLNTKKEFQKILEGLTRHIEEHKQEYMNISFGAYDRTNNNFEKLNGFKLATDGSKYQIDSLSINNFDKDRLIKLYPFIIYHNNDIYFFDSFSSGKKCTDIISYTSGIKEEIRKNNVIWNVCEDIAKLHSMYQIEFNKRNLILASSSDNTSIEDGVFFAEAEKNLLENYTIHDSVKTVYLQKWLQEKIKQDNGVFLFQAHAGTGKTIASMQLEGRINNGIDLSNTTVKVVYINETNNKLGYILDNIELVFTTGLNGENIIRQREKNTVKIVEDISERKKVLANYINSIKSKLEYIGKCSLKLLLVFDGLDELPDEDLDFYDYIPNTDLLNPGIFILATSRTDSEISDRKRKKLNGIQFCDSMQKFQGDEDIMNMCEEYIVKQLTNIKEPEIRKILHIGEKTFLWVYLTVFMINHQIINVDDLDKLNNTNKLIEKYLNYLNSLYGNKNEMILYKIIYLLASDMKFRSLEDISYQIGEEKLSFSLLGIMQDLRAILEINHKITNMFRVNHENKKLAIFNFLKQINRINEVEQETLNMWKVKVEDIAYWNEEELRDYSQYEYSESLDSMMELLPKSFYFLDMLFSHTLAENVNKWKEILTPSSFIFILEKLFAGPNSYLRSKEWVHACKFLAEKMVSFMNKQYEDAEDEMLKGAILYTSDICKAFSFWRNWFAQLQWDEELDDFKSEKSKMHDCYNTVWSFYCEIKSEIEKKGMNQSIYNFLILLEVASLNMIEEFIDFYEEIEEVKLVEKWREIKSNINNNSAMRYDDNMNKFVDFNKFYAYHQNARAYYSNDNVKLMQENINKANNVKEKLLKYDLTVFEQISIDREVLHSKLVFISYRNMNFPQKINEAVIDLSQRLVFLLQKQIDILRSENDDGKRDDDVSECIWHISDTINEFVTAAIVCMQSERKNALKLSKCANQLYELLSDKMQNYYVLQRVNVVSNYVLLLNVTNNFNERNRYLEWYINNRANIMKCIQERKGKICEQAEHGTWLLDLAVAQYRNISVDEVKNKIFKENYFETLRSDDGILRVRCKENHFSKSPKVIGENGIISVKFNKKFCNTCSINTCPAFNGTHEVILDKANDV